MRTVASIVAVLCLALASGRAHASDRRDALGTYERQALDLALATHGFELDPAPEGKTLRHIYVDTQAVFTKGEGILTWLNTLHYTTREDVIEREVLLRPGQPWDDAVVADSMRRLRDPRFTSLVVMMPVKAPEPDRVDLLVVTRDIWSLRLNSSYEIQNGDLVKLLVAPAESNLLGLRKHLALLYELDQGAHSVGPHYLDTNIAGTRLRLETLSSVRFSRAQGAFEGSRSQTSLTYPLWSLQRRWRGRLEVEHADDVSRDWLGSLLRPYDLEATPDVAEAIPLTYDRRITRIDTSATWSFDNAVKHYLSFGHELFINRPALNALGPSAESCGGTPIAECAQRFRQEVLPRSERSSALYAQYSVFTPAFATYRNIDTYDLPEERQLGPDVRLGVAAASRLIGSEQDFLRLTARLGWTLALGADGFATATSQITSRWQALQFVDNEVQAQLVVALPMLADRLRVAGHAELAAYLRDSENRYLTLGGDSGLRGFTVGAFAGEKRVRGNLEVRTIPRRVWFTRLGLLAFWDVGHAANAFADLRLQHDVGLGVRAVIPQLQTSAFRLDWAVPLTGETVGLPGRVILGFEQAFTVLGTSPVLDAVL
jgi:hypothetical protein